MPGAHIPSETLQQSILDHQVDREGNAFLLIEERRKSQGNESRTMESFQKVIKSIGRGITFMRNNVHMENYKKIGKFIALIVLIICLGYLIYTNNISPLAQTRSNIVVCLTSIDKVVKEMKSELKKDDVSSKDKGGAATTAARADTPNGQISASDIDTTLNRLQTTLSSVKGSAISPSNNNSDLVKELRQTSADLIAIRNAEAKNRIELSARLDILDDRISDLNKYTKGLNTSLLSTLMARLHQILVLIISWPVVVAVVLLYMLVNNSAPKKLAEILRPVRSVKLLGAEFALGDELQLNLDSAIKNARKQLREEYDELIPSSGIEALVGKIVNETVTEELKKFGKQAPTDLRTTIHIPDPLFEESLYQLLDYYTSEPNQAKGSGRAFSVRFGIIGKSWRLAKPLTEGKVPKNKEELIESWGMTDEEASKSGQGRQSFCCILLKEDGMAPLGILYMDAMIEDVFGADQKEIEAFQDALLKACRNNGILNAVKMVSGGISKRERVKIYG